MLNALFVGRLGIHVDLDMVSVCVSNRPEVKPPQEFGNGDEEVSLGEVDSGAETAAAAVGVVIALLVVGRCGVFGRRLRAGRISLRVEGVGIGESDGVEMKAPDVDKDHGAFGKEFSVNPIICSRCVSNHAV